MKQHKTELETRHTANRHRRDGAQTQAEAILQKSQSSENKPGNKR